MNAINEKIETAQINCDVEVAILKQDRKDAISRAWESLWLELGRIKAIFKQKVDETETRHVNSILSKVL